MKTSFIVACVGVVVVIAACGTRDSETEILKRNDVRLAIPHQYITKERSPPWIRSASGLDSSEGSALLRIPSAELKTLVPQNGPEPLDSSTLIQILSEEEIERAIKIRIEHVEEVNAQRDQYSGMKVAIDPSTGFYRLYDKYNQGAVNTTRKWEVVRRMPPLSSDDLIATCMRHEMSVMTICELSAFVVDGVVVRMDIQEEHLLNHERFKQHIVELLRSWRVERKSVA